MFYTKKLCTLRINMLGGHWEPHPVEHLCGLAVAGWQGRHPPRWAWYRGDIERKGVSCFLEQPTLPKNASEWLELRSKLHTMERVKYGGLSIGQWVQKIWPLFLALSLTPFVTLRRSYNLAVHLICSKSHQSLLFSLYSYYYFQKDFCFQYLFDFQICKLFQNVLGVW